MKAPSNMASYKVYLHDEGFAKYKEAVHLDSVECKNDKEDDPFRSKYNARKIFDDIQKRIDEYVQEIPEDETLKIISGLLNLKKACNYINTEELSTGEAHLNKCIEALEILKLDSRVCAIFLDCLNQIGILWTGRMEDDKALIYLHRAETLYNHYKADSKDSPWIPDELLREYCFDLDKADQERRTHFESLFTHTLYYIAQVYSRLDEREKSANYCHTTLKRQLDYGKYDHTDWATNAATLSQYYLTDSDFESARHLLASASFIISEGDQCSVRETTADGEHVLAQRKADIDRCWAQYGLVLLEESRDILMKEVAELDIKDTASKADNQASEAEANKCMNGEMTNSDQSNNDNNLERKKHFRFNLDVTLLENQVPDQYLKIFSEAKEIFLMIQTRLKDSQKFYQLDEYCSDHVEITQTFSKAYKFLAFFENDLSNQCKMHKRRIDMLTAELAELNPQHYLLICRQMMYEIAEAYSSMVDLKAAIMEVTDGPPSVQALKKINQLCQKSIAQYQTYLDTLKGTDKEYPSEFCESDARPALVAMFCSGRLYSKFHCADVSQKIMNIKKSLEMYKYLVEYCKRNPSASEIVTGELSVCEEMVTLLPLKIERILQLSAK